MHVNNTKYVTHSTNVNVRMGTTSATPTPLTSVQRANTNVEMIRHETPMTVTTKRSRENSIDSAMDGDANSANNNMKKTTERGERGERGAPESRGMSEMDIKATRRDCVLIQFAVKYAVLAAVTAVSTLLAIIVFLVLYSMGNSGKGSPISSNIDAAINSACLVLIHGTYDKVYHRMCGGVDRLCHEWAVPKIIQDTVQRTSTEQWSTD